MNFFRISCFFITFVLVSCNPIDIRNEQRFSDVLSIVVSENGVKYIENRFSTFLIEGLDTIPEETCGFASYVVDFENQPKETPPFEARLLSWKELGASTFRYIQGGILSDYKDTLFSASFNSNLRHFIFLTVNHQKILKDDDYRYELLCCKDSVDKNGIMTMYLKTKLNSPGTDSVRVNINYLIAFNIRKLWDEQIAQGNDSLIRFNLKYSNRTDSVGNIIYSLYNKTVRIPLIP